MAGRLLGEARKRAGVDDFAQGRIALPIACGQIDQPAVDDGAVRVLPPKA